MNLETMGEKLECSKQFLEYWVQPNIIYVWGPCEFCHFMQNLFA